MNNENELTAALATIEKCREVSGCPEGVDLQDHLRQLAAHRESRQNALGNFREGGQMSKIQKPTVPDWMQPTAPLTDLQREELRQAIRAYIRRRKDEECAA